jgi:chromosomal replication initiator protein
LHGILDAWRKNQKKNEVKRNSYYLSAADFARYYVEAIHTKTTEDFCRRYRGAALLLIDDLEELNNRPNVQEELQNILDEQSQTGGICLLAATGQVSSLTFSKPLTARLLGGTTVPVFLPGFAVRKQLLTDFAAALRVQLTEESLNFLAEKWTFSVPQLSGRFSQMVFEATHRQDDKPSAVSAKGRTGLTSAFIKHFALQHAEPPSVNIDSIAKRTAKHFSLKLSDLKGTSRNKTTALARSIAVYLAREQTELPIREIGEYFGKRDPSTVRNMLEKIRNGLSDPILRNHLFQLK